MKPKYLTIAFAFLLIAKISAQPILKWQANIHEPDYREIYVIDLKTDQTGNIYVMTTDNYTGSVITKFDSSGNLLWKYHLSIKEWHYPAFSRMLILDNGNIAIFVSHLNELFSHHYFKFKRFLSCYILSPSGTLIHYNSTDHFYYSGLPAIITKDQHLVVASGSDKVEICELDSGAHFINGKIFFDWKDGGFIHGLAIDSSNNVIFCGNKLGGVTDSGVIEKLDKNFNPVWSVKTPGLLQWQVKTDQDGNIYSQGSNFHNYVITKLSPQGHILWKQNLLKPSNGSLSGGSFVIDSAGNLICLVNTDANYPPSSLVKISSDGETIWSQLFQTYTIYGGASQIAFLPGNHLLLTGYKTVVDSGKFLAYGVFQERDGNGNLQWTQDYSTLEGMTVFNKNAIYVCSEYSNGIQLNRFALPEEMPKIQPNIPRFQTISIYPNPVSQQAQIDWTQSASSAIEINLTDMNGRIMRNILTGNFDEGEHNAVLDRNDLDPGIYLLELISKEGIVTKKIVVSPSSQ